MDPIAATTALVALGSGVVGLVVARRRLLGLGLGALAPTCLRTGTLPTAATWEGVNAVGLVAAMVIVAAAAERSGCWPGSPSGWPPVSGGRGCCSPPPSPSPWCSRPRATSTPPPCCSRR
ncbi:MAG: hypothetical protein R2755_07140 [Acidimicrobiales bacterium]